MRYLTPEQSTIRAEVLRQLDHAQALLEAAIVVRDLRVPSLLPEVERLMHASIEQENEAHHRARQAGLELTNL